MNTEEAYEGKLGSDGPRVLPLAVPCSTQMLLHRQKYQFPRQRIILKTSRNHSVIFIIYHYMQASISSERARARY